MPSSTEKWNISLFSVVIFILVANPYTFRLTNRLLGPILGKIAVDGCPTTLGLVLHSIVYLLVVRYSMDLNLNFK
jgi:hypothetical protein